MTGNFSFTDREEIQKTALEALRRMDNKNNKEEQRIRLIEERDSKLFYDQAVFEEYDQDNWTDKVKKDSHIYNTFISEVDDDVGEKIQYLLTDLLKNVNSIYEHININPVIGGFKNLPLDASDEELQKESENIIENFFKKHYYGLSNYERNKLYKERTCSFGKDIILNEKIEIKDAVEHAYKSIIIEQLLNNINFPKTVYYRIQELMSSDIYGEIFEQDKLIDLWTEFGKKASTVSRVFAQLV
ncbi:MAG: hypothetical protein H8D97_01400 [Proteobacteria bacterium]|nr:hypothetical protein [Pseudomonadota bacterium]